MKKRLIIFPGKGVGYNSFYVYNGLLPFHMVEGHFHIPKLRCFCFGGLSFDLWDPHAPLPPPSLEPPMYVFR